jgi:hypothetical protein
VDEQERRPGTGAVITDPQTVDLDRRHPGASLDPPPRAGNGPM